MNGQYMRYLFHVLEFKPSFQVRLPSVLVTTRHMWTVSAISHTIHH